VNNADASSESSQPASLQLPSMDNKDDDFGDFQSVTSMKSEVLPPKKGMNHDPLPATTPVASPLKYPLPQKVSPPKRLSPPKVVGQDLVAQLSSYSANFSSSTTSTTSATTATATATTTTIATASFKWEDLEGLFSMPTSTSNPVPKNDPLPEPSSNPLFSPQPALNLEPLVQSPEPEPDKPPKRLSSVEDAGHADPFDLMGDTGEVSTLGAVVDEDLDIDLDTLQKVKKQVAIPKPIVVAPIQLSESASRKSSRASSSEQDEQLEEGQQQQQGEDDPRASDWLRALDAVRRLLVQAEHCLRELHLQPNLADLVLEDPQGEDYVMCLKEAMRVHLRISSTLSTCDAGVVVKAAKQEASSVEKSWATLQEILPIKIECLSDTSEAELLWTCPICGCGPTALTGAGLVNYEVEHEGRRYHAPCANLWLNVVDDNLPS